MGGAEPKEMSKWQLIKTAPMDGTAVLLHIPALRPAVLSSWYNNNWVNHAGFRLVDKLKPTHWMPLPDPPEGVTP